MKTYKIPNGILELVIYITIIVGSGLATKMYIGWWSIVCFGPTYYLLLKIIGKALKYDDLITY